MFDPFLRNIRHLVLLACLLTGIAAPAALPAYAASGVDRQATVLTAALSQTCLVTDAGDDLVADIVMGDDPDGLPASSLLPEKPGFDRTFDGAPPQVAPAKTPQVGWFGRAPPSR